MEKEQTHSVIFTFLTMLSATVMFISYLLVGKLIILGPLTSTAGSLVLPFWFILNDMIAEVYGYKMARKNYWCVMMCLLVFCLANNLLIHLPSPSFWQKQKSYNDTLGHLLFYFLTAFPALTLAGFTNTYLLSKWKILLRGRYFGLRSIGASGVGELLYSVIVSITAFAGELPTEKIFSIMTVAFLLKITYAILLATPANILVVYLKKIEKTNVYDYDTNFNPFRLN